MENVAVALLDEAERPWRPRHRRIDQGQRLLWEAVCKQALTGADLTSL